MGLIVVSVVLLWIIMGLVCWLMYQLVLQNGRVLRRLEALEQRFAEPPAMPGVAPDLSAGLRIGSAAPDFELPDLSGGRIRLSAWRGQRVLLIFFDPRASFCRQMLPALAALPSDPATGRPVPLVLTTGTAEENRQLVEEYRLRCPVLLQDDTEICSAYQVGSMPMGYLIDERGTIASVGAVGAQALLALAGEPPAVVPGREEPGAAVNGNAYAVHQGNHSLSGRNSNRNGLPVGTRAPVFRLPRIDGGELSLLEYRGRKVLLVFSDPACEPCDDLAPELEQLHRRPLDLAVLMVSRGDPEANRVKVAEHGLTFPVVLQRHWEISRDYGMVAAPLGYLIDEWGMIAADVAVGTEPILALVSSATASNGNAQAAPRKGVVSGQ